MSVRVFESKIDLLPSRDQRQRAEHCLGAQEIERLAAIRRGDSIVCSRGRSSEACRNFSATTRFSSRSSAFHTTPIPPSPSFSRTR